MTVARRGAAIYLLATIVSMASALIRYTLMARLLGPEQLGLAATIILTGQFFDSITDSGGDRFLIQDRDGDKPEVQGLIHAILVGRGVLVALALVAFAGPIAKFYHAPDLNWALMALGLSPLISGLVHTDTARRQRVSDFRGESITVLAAETLSTLATGVAAYLTHNFTAIVYGLIARSLFTVLVTHLCAERPYRLALAREHFARVAMFALPLMVNGLMLFLGGQGDRILVANRLGPSELGLYSTVTLLAFYPISTVAKFMGGLHLPPIATTREDRETHGRTTDVLGGQTLLLALVMMVGFIIAAPLAITIFFGSKFAQTGAVIGWVAVLQTIRYMRLWPTTIGLAYGRSGLVMTTNIVRLAAFPAAIVAWRWMGGVQGVVAGFVVGELLALVVGLWMLNRRSFTAWHGYDRVALFLLGSATVLAWEQVLGAGVTPGRLMVLAGLSTAVAIAVIVRERQTIHNAASRALELVRLRVMTR